MNRILMSTGARFPTLSGTITRPGEQDLGLVAGDISEIRLRIRKEDEETGTYKIDEPVTSFTVNGNRIDWEYLWADGDTDEAGKYWGQLQIVLSDGRVGYAPTNPEWFPVLVRPFL